MEGKVETGRESSSAEKGQSPFRFFVQYLLSPILVALLGIYFNSRLEATKTDVERMKMAEQLLPNLFGKNHSQALASEKLLSRLVDSQLADELNQITEDYFTEMADDFAHCQLGLRARGFRRRQDQCCTTERPNL